MLTKKRITIASVAAATVAGLALTATSAGAQEPGITVTPTEAAPGESFTVSGPPCDALLEPTRVDVSLEGTGASTSIAEEDQNWTVTLTVPEGTAAGEYVVAADCVDLSGLFVEDLGRVSFTVTDSPSTTTTSLPDDTTTTPPTTEPGTPPTSEPGDDGDGDGDGEGEGEGEGNGNGTAGGPDTGTPTDPAEGTASAEGDTASIPDGPETEPSEPAPPVAGEPTYTG